MNNIFKFPCSSRIFNAIFSSHSSADTELRTPTLSYSSRLSRRRVPQLFTYHVLKHSRPAGRTGFPRVRLEKAKSSDVA